MRKPSEMGAFSIPQKGDLMAAVKTPAKPKNTFTEKSKNKDKFSCFAITILIEDQSNGNRPYILDYFHEAVEEGSYDNQNGDWAIKAIKITPEQFKEAYEQL